MSKVEPNKQARSFGVSYGKGDGHASGGFVAPRVVLSATCTLSCSLNGFLFPIHSIEVLPALRDGWRSRATAVANALPRQPLVAL